MITPQIQEITDFAKGLATQAGEMIRTAYLAQPAAGNSERKSPKGTKLADDATIDAWLVSQIKEHYPDHVIMAEESGEHAGASSVTWIVDPIDGSMNFAARNPFVAVSIGVIVDDMLSVGVIEAPLLNEQFVAVKGEGATVISNGVESPIHVSNVSELQNAFMVSCEGGVEDRTEVFSVLIRNYYDQVKDFRKLGSAALECAWVATGRADIYMAMELDAWDVAAGVLLIEEAGGKVTTFKSEPWSPVKTDLVCSNGKLHEILMNRIWV